jgi:hypothetical protein
VEGSSDEQDNVIDHITISDVVKEGRQRFNTVATDILELCDHLLDTFVLDGGGGEWRWLIGEEITIISLGQVKSNVFESLALDEVGIVIGGEKTLAVATEDGVDVSVVNVESERRADRHGRRRNVFCKFFFFYKIKKKYVYR